MEKKTCPHCGAALPPDAAFCPRCTATLTERTVMVMPRTASRRLRWGLALSAAAVLVAVLLLLLPRTAELPPADAKTPAAPDAAMDPYLAACQTYYTGADGREYYLFTAMTPEPTGRTEPVGYHTELIPADGTVSCPATVIVEDAISQEYAAEDFAALLESWEIAVNAPEGVGRVRLPDAEQETLESPALLYRRLWADSTCTHNEVVWTLRMKNGDELRLTMTLEYVEQQVLRFGGEDTPLATSEELQTLLDRLAETYDADTKLIVELPEVTYTRPVTVGCAVELVGNGTTFAAPVTVSALHDTERVHAFVRFKEVSFIGDGTGTGVTAGAPTYLEICRLTDWAVGALAVNGGWVYLREDYIGGNGVGVRYDSVYSSSYTYSIDRIDFVNNDSALEILCMPPRSHAALNDCRFTGNGTDVTNPSGYRVELVNGTEAVL